MRGVNDSVPQLLDLCFALLDGATITPYYFYMCDMIPFSEHWRVSVKDAQHLQHGILGYLPGFATPRIVCDVPYVGKRWVHQLSEYDEVRGISYWKKNYRTGIEQQDPEALEPHLRVLRPDRHPARPRARTGGSSTPATRSPRPPPKPKPPATPPNPRSSSRSPDPESPVPLCRGRHRGFCLSSSVADDHPTEEVALAVVGQGFG